MKKELNNNVVFFHKECAEEKLKEFQKTFDKDKIKINCHVKSGIPVCNLDKDIIEHMWVKVIAIDEFYVTGILDNIPIYPNANCKLGDIINVYFHNIANVVY
jgi:uncharacterized protein YegJ (DUF2314 family)